MQRYGVFLITQWGLRRAAGAPATGSWEDSQGLGAAYTQPAQHPRLWAQPGGQVAGSLCQHEGLQVSIPGLLAKPQPQLRSTGLEQWPSVLYHLPAGATGTGSAIATPTASQASAPTRGCSIVGFMLATDSMGPSQSSAVMWVGGSFPEDRSSQRASSGPPRRP